MPGKGQDAAGCWQEKAGNCSVCKSRQATSMPAETGDCDARRDTGTELISAHIQKALDRSCGQQATVSRSFGPDPSVWLYGVAMCSREQESVKTPIPVLAQLSQRLTNFANVACKLYICPGSNCVRYSTCKHHVCMVTCC